MKEKESYNLKYPDELKLSSEVVVTGSGGWFVHILYATAKVILSYVAEGKHSCVISKVYGVATPCLTIDQALERSCNLYMNE